MLAAIQHDYSGLASVTLEHVHDPEPGPTGTLIETAYAPVIPWDIKAEKGNIRERALPAVVGYALSGIVIAAGPFGAKNRIGQRVIAAAPGGSNAQKAVAPFAPFVFPVPDAVSMAQAATIIGGGDAALLLSKAANLQAGARLLVAGANGSVGSWLVQLLNLRGIETHVLSSTRSLQINRELFADSIGLVTDRPENLEAEYTVAIDLTGSETILRTLECKLVSGGTLVMAATPNYRARRTDIRAIFRNNPIKPSEYTWLLGLLAKREVTAVIDTVYPLSRIHEAQQHVKIGPHRGRTLLRVNDAEA